MSPRRKRPWPSQLSRRSKPPRSRRPRPKLPRSKRPASEPQARREPCARQGHDHVARRARLGRQDMLSGAESAPSTEACSASAGSRRSRPWWRWRPWRARSAARWRPQVCRMLSAATSQAPAAPARWKPPSRGSMPTSQALKTGVEHTSKLGMNQFNKTSERLDKVEKAQAEPAAKLAKLSETVDKLRAAAGCGARRRGRRAAQAPARKSPVDRIDRRPAAAAARRRSRRRPRQDGSRAGCRRWKAGCCATSPMAAP